MSLTTKAYLRKPPLRLDAYKLAPNLGNVEYSKKSTKTSLVLLNQN